MSGIVIKVVTELQHISKPFHFVSRSSLLSKEGSREMAKTLHGAFGCDLLAMLEELSSLELDDFGEYKKESKDESAMAVFKAALQASPHVDSFAPDTPAGQFATRKHLLGLVAKMRSLQGHEKVMKALEKLATGLPDLDSLGFSDLKTAVRQIPRVAAQRMAFAESLQLTAALARHLPPGTLDDGLAGLKKLGQDTSWVNDVLEAFFIDVQHIVKEAVREVVEAKGSTSAAEANSKFDGFVGSFASLQEFHAGAEETLKLAQPNPDVEKGILNDLTRHRSADQLFVTPNYQILTSLRTEYYFAKDPNNTPPEVKEQLRKLRVEREDEQPAPPGAEGDAPKQDLGDAPFPGEVGDRFFETWLMLSLPAGSDVGAVAPKLTAAALTQKLKDKMVLKSDEEQVRGVRMLSRRDCVAWERRSKCILAPSEEEIERADAESRAETVVGLMLPMTQARAQSRLEAVNAAVAELCRVNQWTLPEVTVRHLLTQREVVYETLPGPTDLRKQLDKMSNSELKETAAKVWGVTHTNREATRDAVVRAFLCKELKGTFAAALQAHAEEGALLMLLSAWGVEAQASSRSREGLIAAAADALNTERRFQDVACWLALFVCRMQSRKRIGLASLLEREKISIEKCDMQPAEVLAVYIYTGPLFMLMNTVCRSYPPNLLQLLHGVHGDEDRNTLSTLLFCVTSGLKKIGRQTELPASGKVFRGLGSMLLPRDFWVAHDSPAWRGGVEKAFMSTTTDKDVALFYANGKGTVVEISVGRIQIGGVISWLSMVRIREALWGAARVDVNLLNLHPPAVLHSWYCPSRWRDCARF